MSEKSQFKDVLIKITIVVICGILYSLGGADFGAGKWLRRIAMPLVMTSGMFWFSRDWRSLISAPLLALGTSLGYGGDDTAIKIVKRLYCGFILGVGSSIGDLLNKRFIIGVLQVIFVTLIMTIFGVWNPLPDARTEEFVIGICIALFPVMSARRR